MAIHPISVTNHAYGFLQGRRSADPVRGFSLTGVHLAFSLASSKQYSGSHGHRFLAAAALAGSTAARGRWRAAWWQLHGAARV